MICLHSTTFRKLISVLRKPKEGTLTYDVSYCSRFPQDAQPAFAIPDGIRAAEEQIAAGR